MSEEIESVMEFMREKGLSASRTALIEDVLDRADFENFLFPISPPPPLKIPVAGGFSGYGSDDEFVSLGSSSSEFTNPYGVRTTTEVCSRSSSERLSQFGTARDYHDFDMQNDLYWYNEKDDDFAMPSHFDGHDQFTTPSEDKFIMAAELEKPIERESVSAEESISVDQPWALSISPLKDMNGDGITSYNESKEYSIYEEIRNVNSANYKDPAPLHEQSLDGEEVSNSDIKCEQKHYLGGDGEEGTAELLIHDESEAEHEVFYLRIIHRKNRTGFEENKEMPIFLNSIIGGRYCITEYLGSAAFSKVVQAQDLLTGVDVCLKIIKNNKDFFDQSLDEIKLLKFVNKHDPGDERHILRLYDYFYFQEHLFIVCELLRANLYEFQKHNQESGAEPYFTLIRIQLIAKQCLEALEYLHYLGIIHCDLKPENILMKSYSRCEIKVIDLGSSCFEMDNLCLYVQSRSYRAPEVILGLPYNQKIDIWSLGCILAELYSGEVLFPNDALVMLLARMIGILGPIDMDMLGKGQETHKYFTEEHDLYMINEETNQLEYLNPENSSLEHHLQVSDSGFINFLRDLLQINPQRRPTAREALDHPWFSHQYSL